jgi:hypothetical protein
MKRKRKTNVVHFVVGKTMLVSLVGGTLTLTLTLTLKITLVKMVAGNARKQIKK